MSKDSFLSTSKLAEALNIEGKKLFKHLKDHNWIEREGDHWRLTEAGKFSGGQYFHSEKYGDYIVWPEDIVNHPLLAEYEEDWVSSTRLGEQLGLSAHQLNLLFAHLGWIEKDQRGWMITEAGRTAGGEQRSSKHGFFVMWPGAIKRNPEYKEAIDNVLGNVTGKTLDGHQGLNAGEMKIDNWLYLHDLVHAYHYRLPGTDITSTFFLPGRKVFIDYWGFDLSSGTLSEQLGRQKYYKEHGLRHIDLGDEDLKNLDEVLSQRLLQFGIQIK